MEVYLDIKNPINLTDPTLATPQLKKIYKALKDAGDFTDLDFDATNGSASYRKLLTASSLSNTQIFEVIKQAGFDGVIVPRLLDDYEYIAFSPNQIKSATDNVGTYDSANPDIRFQESEEELEEGNHTFRINKKGMITVDDIKKYLKKNNIDYSEATI
jgi:hypothetical protein